MGKLSVAAHALIDHAAITGTGISQATHDASDHTAVPGVSSVTANRQTASYTLVLGDRGKVVEMNVAGANNLTVPLNAAAAYAVGTLIEVYQYGAGQTTIVATGGVTLRSPSGKLKLTGQYSSATLRKIAADEWAVSGDLAA